MLDISRHREIFEPHSFTTPIHIIGAGATGSWLALILAKLGIEDITVWDFDVVEEHNVSNQLYSFKDIGSPKINSLEEEVANQTNTFIKTKEEEVTNQHLAGVVFLMVDTMKTRKEIWENCIKMKPNIQLIIEPRMGIDMGRIYNINPTDLTQIKEYEKSFYSDEEAETSYCGTELSIITSALTIASWCGRQLIEWHNEETLENEILIDFKYNNIITNNWNFTITV